MKKQLASSLAVFSALTACQLAKANVIADWTFETSQPTTAGPFNPEVGSGSASISTGGTITSPAGNGSAHSFSSTSWDVNDYFQFTVSTTGFEDITISLDQTGSNTGPKTFELAYSTDGSSFTTLPTYNLSNDSWSGTGASKPVSTHSFDLSSIGALDNQSTVYFRVIDASTTSINGGTVAVAGTDRIDNFIVNGTIAPVPEPSTIALATIGGIACLVATRRKR